MPRPAPLAACRHAVTRKRFHLARLIFWAAQIPFAVWAAFVPALERPLFAYLVVISLAALVESAGTDYDQAHHAEQVDER